VEWCFLVERFLVGSFLVGSFVEQQVVVACLVERCLVERRLLVERLLVGSLLVWKRVAGIEVRGVPCAASAGTSRSVGSRLASFSNMQTIGLIGGMSWESTAQYYRLINEQVKERLGGLHSAKIILYSVDFAEVEDLQQRGEWKQATTLMVKAGQRVKAGGADFIVICTNTMHRLADQVERQTALPVLHIADATARVIAEAKIGVVGLLGTRYTMEEEFYRGRLETRYGLEVLIPEEDDRTFVHDVIYNELCLGVTRDESRRAYLDIIKQLEQRGAAAVILGCTEIGLLIGPTDTDTLLFDTTRIHAEAAADRAVESS